MPRVIEIRDFDQLTGYRLLWHKLLAETRNASYFQSFDWLEAYWRHHGAGQSLRVLLVRSGDETLGILPLTVRTESTKVGSLRVLTYPLDDFGAFYGPIGSQPAATLTAGLKYVQQSPRDWDLLDLRGVNRDGCDFGRTANALSFNQFQVNEQHWRQVPSIDLSEGWEDYWESRDGAFRASVEKSERRLRQTGEVEFVRYRSAGAAYDDGDPRWDLYDACESLAGERSASSVEAHDFLRDAHLNATHVGALDLNLLLVQRRPVAFAYNFHYQGQVECLQLGFDANCASCEPANVLLLRILQDSCQRGDHTLRVGCPISSADRAWFTSIETSYRYSHFPLSVIRAQALRFNRWMHGRKQA